MVANKLYPIPLVLSIENTYTFVLELSPAKNPFILQHKRAYPVYFLLFAGMPDKY